MVDITSETVRSTIRNLEQDEVNATDRDLILRVLHNVLPTLQPAQAEEKAERVSDNGDGQPLEAAIVRQQSEQEAFRLVSQQLTANMDLKQILRSILTQLMNLLSKGSETADLRSAEIYLYEAGRLNHGAVVYMEDTGAGAAPAAAAAPASMSQLQPHRLSYSVARLGKSITITDLETHALFSGSGISGSAVGIPLKIGPRIVGVLSVERNRSGEFHEEDMKVINLFGTQAAIAIENTRLNELVDRTARPDPLTGMHNQRSLNERLDSEVMNYRAAEVTQGVLGAQHSFCLVLVDLDDFTQINQTYGRLAGDYVLKEIAYAASRALRKTDFLARYGGDELAAVLSSSDAEAALNVATRIQDFVSMCRFNLPDIRQKVLTVSIGIALFPEHGSSVDELMVAAKRALEEAKSQKQGSVVMAEAASAPPGTGDIGAGSPPASDS
jgi:diguanylate cyclase (GGDEF)-like protein